MTGNLRFQFRPGLTLCVVLALGVLLTLGNWQMRRLDWKLTLMDQVEDRLGSAPMNLDKMTLGADDRYQPVSITGAFEQREPIRLFAAYKSKPGVYLFSPFTTPVGETVFVNRGFISQINREADLMPPVGERRIEGLFRLTEEPTPPASWFRTVGADANGNWYLRDPKAMAQSIGIAPESVASFYIDQFETEDDVALGGTTRVEFRNNHLDYALTWYGLAVVLFGMWLVMSFRRRR